MSTINELIHTIKSGIRTNKYRIIIPGPSSRDLSIICHTSSLPGRIITPVDVVVKGKKTQVVGETSLSGSWTATFYNEEGMIARNFFSRWIEGLHSLDLNIDSGIFSRTKKLIGDISGTVRILENLDVSSLIDSIIGVVQSPSYQRDIKVQQLDGEENVVFEVTITGAFPINIEDISLDASNSDLSSTSVTFAFTDIKIGNNSNNKLKNIL